MDPLGVQGEASNQSPVGSHDADVTVGHQDQHRLFVVPPADRHVVERALLTQRDVAAVDLVLADPTVGWHLEGLPRGPALGAGRERGLGGSPTEGAMGPDGVVVVELGLQQIPFTPSSVAVIRSL